MVANTPIVANASAQELLDDAYQDDDQNPTVLAIRLGKQKLAAETLFQMEKITETEFGREKIFYTEQMIGATAAGPVLNAEGGPTVAASIAALSLQLGNMEN
jgi:hypothetical protein